MPTPYSDITKRIKQALSKFDKAIPGLQGKVYAEMLEQVKRLDIRDGRIAVTVKNLSILNSIKGKLNRIILNDEYRGEIKDFAKAFNDVYKLQAEYWRGIESTFKPRPLLKAIRNQSITDVVKGLTDGIGANVSDALINILRTNITAIATRPIAIMTAHQGNAAIASLKFRRAPYAMVDEFSMRIQ